MIPRIAFRDVESALERQAAAALIGPRQAGKTTLALEFVRARGAMYLDLEERADRDKLAEPGLFLDRFEDRLVILDEIHRAPDLFQSLRSVIDRGRRKGRGKGRFLVLGSASIDLLRQTGETLAGRIAYVDMAPLNALEAEDSREARERLWLRGGFPDSYLARSDRESMALRRDFVRTYLERDVAMFGPRVPAPTLERLWTMLAHGQGTLSNASTLAGALGASARSVSRYIDLLAELLLVRRLPPLRANIGKRLVKSPKVYVRDSGLVHALLGIETPEQLAGHPVAGRSWEGHVVETLLSVLPPGAAAAFYRTSAGAEIDLVIDLAGGGGRLAVEIKRSLSARPSRGFHAARADLSPSRAFVVHAGEDRYPAAEGVEAIGVRELAAELRALAR